MLRWIHRAYNASLVPVDRAFLRALHDPQKAQDRILRDILRANATTHFGKIQGFDAVDGTEAFQARVPVNQYDDLQPWIQQMLDGTPNVLTSEPVLMFEKTGGSTGVNKYIPYTASLLGQISNATRPWIRDLYRQHAPLLDTTQYWSVSPGIKKQEYSAGGVPIGLEDDTEYFDALSRWAIKRILSVPNQIGHINDWEAWRQETAISLLNDERLGLISVWSPTFLTVLSQYIVAHGESLCHTLALPRARKLHAILERSDGAVVPIEQMWPRLSLISCWTDGESRAFVGALRQFFPGTPIQGKGLMATEGVVSIPYGQVATSSEMDASGSPLAVTSHFLEFIDLNDTAARPCVASGLKVGGRYSPLLTTAGGLYRYHLKDVIECVGYLHATPLVSFRGKLDRVSDIAGEKLHVAQVNTALVAATEASGLRPEFVMLSPSRGARPGYCLFIESTASDTQLRHYSSIVETSLAASHHYAYCRSLAQLAPLEFRRVSHGWLTYQAALVNAGHSLGAIKPTVLEYKYDWHTIFGVNSTHDGM